MNYSRLISLTALAVALLLSVGCESINIPPVSRDDSPGQHGPGLEAGGNSTIDAYDLIVRTSP